MSRTMTVSLCAYFYGSILGVVFSARPPHGLRLTLFWCRIGELLCLNHISHGQLRLGSMKKLPEILPMMPSGCLSPCDAFIGA